MSEVGEEMCQAEVAHHANKCPEYLISRSLKYVHLYKKALAISTDCTPRYVHADPYEGGKQAIAEAYRLEFEEHAHSLRHQMRSIGCTFRRLRTDASVEENILQVLASRDSKLARKGR